jgi:hypothetical protein
LREVFKLKVESILVVTAFFVQESNVLNVTMVVKKMSDTLFVQCKVLSDAMIWDRSSGVEWLLTRQKFGISRQTIHILARKHKKWRANTYRAKKRLYLAR